MLKQSRIDQTVNCNEKWRTHLAFYTFYAVVSEIGMYACVIVLCICVYQYIHTILYIVINPTLTHQS